VFDRTKAETRARRPGRPVVPSLRARESRWGGGPTGAVASSSRARTTKTRGGRRPVDPSPSRAHARLRRSVAPAWRLVASTQVGCVSTSFTPWPSPSFMGSTTTSTGRPPGVGVPPPGGVLLTGEVRVGAVRATLGGATWKPGRADRRYTHRGAAPLGEGSLPTPHELRNPYSPEAAMTYRCLRTTGEGVPPLPPVRRSAPYFRNTRCPSRPGRDRRPPPSVPFPGTEGGVVLAAVVLEAEAPAGGGGSSSPWPPTIDPVPPRLGVCTGSKIRAIPRRRARTGSTGPPSTGLDSRCPLPLPGRGRRRPRGRARPGRRRRRPAPRRRPGKRWWPPKKSAGWYHRPDAGGARVTRGSVGRSIRPPRVGVLRPVELPGRPTDKNR